MIEDEANKKWCPFARVNFPASEGSAGSNRFCDGTPFYNANCLGEKCAAWRFEKETVTDVFPGEEDMLGTEHESPDQGYCGLAGKP